MWALSSSSPFGSVTETLRVLASPGLAVRTAWIAGWPRRLIEPRELSFELRPVGEVRAVGDLEVRASGWPSPPSSPMISALDRERVAVGRVEREAGPVEVDQDRAQPQRDPLDDLRDRVGDRGHLGGDRVDRDADPDRRRCRGRRGPNGRGDDDQAELARPCTGRRGRPCPARGAGCVPAPTRRRVDGPTWLAAGQDGCGLLGDARVAGVAEMGDRRLGAVGDAPQGRREPGRRRDARRPSSVCSPSVRADRDRERRVEPGGLVGDAGEEAGLERQRLARAGRPVRPRVEGEELLRGLFGQRRVPGREGAFDRVGAAPRRRRQHAPLGPEQVHVEARERELRQVVEGHPDLAGDGVGDDPTRDLAWMPKPSATSSRRYRFAGLRLARDRRSREAGPGAPSSRSRASRSSRTRGIRRRGRAGRSCASRVGADGLAVGGVGVDREPFGQGHVGAVDR